MAYPRSHVGPAPRPSNPLVQSPDRDLPDPDACYLLRVRDGTRRWWIASNWKHTVRGMNRENQLTVKKRFVELHGEQKRFIRFEGMHSVAEAAATLSWIKYFAEKPIAAAEEKGVQQ